MKSKTIFRTICFDNNPKLSDFPQNIPIPRIGEIVQFGDSRGYVKIINHLISDDCSVVETRITLTKNKNNLN